MRFLMENRRQTYRHCFPAGRELPARVSGIGGWESPAVIVNLSIGGARLAVEKGSELRAGDRVTLEFAVSSSPAGTSRLRLPIQIRYVEPKQAAWTCGGEFLAPVETALRENQEQVIWKFLLDEQRIAYRSRLAG